MTAGARDTWLDQLEALHTAATPGPWENPLPFRKLIDAPGTTDNLAIVQCDEIADAAAIVAEHNAMPALLALARGVTALAEELESFTVNRNPAPGSYDAGVVATFVNAAARLRRLLADAAPDEEAR